MERISAPESNSAKRPMLARRRRRGAQGGDHQFNQSYHYLAERSQRKARYGSNRYHASSISLPPSQHRPGGDPSRTSSHIITQIQHLRDLFLISELRVSRKHAPQLAIEVVIWIGILAAQAVELNSQRHERVSKLCRN